MKILFIMHGLAGAGYHGGAVTCWAIVKAMLKKGHQVSFLSLFDTSANNPYLDSKDEQVKALLDLGAEVSFLDYDYNLISGFKKQGKLAKIKEGIGSLFFPQLKDFFPWAKLKPEVKKKASEIKPDLIFCYHFDALSAVYALETVPVTVGLGDLWHLPGFFRLKLKGFSFLSFGEAIYRLVTAYYSKKFMIKMLKPCKKVGAFAAHYAKWLKKQPGLEDTLYFRTPVPDSIQATKRWPLPSSDKGKKAKILMIGDLDTTSTRAGVRLFSKKILPALEKGLGKDNFEVHIVGGGSLSDKTRKRFKDLPVFLRGRVVPADSEFLSASLLLVPTSISLGIRVRIITAFSYGTPVVTHKANKEGIPELEDDYNALIGNNYREIADKVIALINNLSLQQRLSRQGRLTYEKYFSEERAAGRIVSELESICKNKKQEKKEVNL